MGKLRYKNGVNEVVEPTKKVYEDEQLKSSFQSDVLGKVIPTLKNVSTEKNPILFKEEIVKKQDNPYISFKQMSDTDKKLYRAGMASGKDFKVGGRDYKAATKEEQTFSAKMASKGKLKSTKQSNVKETFNWESLNNERKSTIGKNFGTEKTPGTGIRFKTETVLPPKDRPFFHIRTDAEQNLDVKTNRQNLKKLGGWFQEFMPSSQTLLDMRKKVKDQSRLNDIKHKQEEELLLKKLQKLNDKVKSSNDLYSKNKAESELTTKNSLNRINKDLENLKNKKFGLLKFNPKINSFK
jgi:hypothetical protein